MDFCWQTAEQSIVRKLGWSLFSPSILEITLPAHEPTWRIQEDEEALYILQSLEKNPAPLNTLLASRRDRRLGACFESLWEYFFDNHSFYRILAKNRQIFDGKTTLGALDFVIEDQKRNRIVHLELAVKFYLYFPDAAGTGLQKWVGPNPDDNLAIKHRHLIQHQLPLSAEPATIAALKSLEIPQPQLKAAIVKGYLFSPLGQFVSPGPPVEKGHLRGRWVRSGDVEKLERDYPCWEWQTLNKEHWLDPALPGGRNHRLIAKESKNLSIGSTQPRLIIGRSPGDSNAEQEELLRCFVVPDEWPASFQDGDPEGT